MPRKKKPTKKKRHQDFVDSRQLPVKAMQQQILKMYAQGTPTEVIAQELQMHQTHVTRALNHAIDRLIDHYASASPQQTFVSYASFQMSIIQKLQRTYEKYMDDPNAKQYNAGIQALKAQSDIYDKILEQGHTYGVVERKKVDRRAIDSDKDNLRGVLVTEITQLERLVDSIDEATLSRTLATRTTTKYVRLIRKPLRNEYGVKQALPDWKYRREIYKQRPDGVYVKTRKTNLSPEEQELLPERDPDYKIHKALADAQGKVVVQTQDGHTFYIDRENLSTTQPENKEIVLADDKEEETADGGEEDVSWLVEPETI